MTGYKILMFRAVFFTILQTRHKRNVDPLIPQEIENV